MLPFGMVAAAVGATGQVTLTNANVSELSKAAPSGAWNVGIRLADDGKLYSIKGDDGAGGPTYVALNSSTNWVIPNFAGGAGFQAQATISGDALDVGSSTSGSYIPVTGNLDWFYAEEVTGKSGTLTIAVRRGTGADLDTSAHVLTLTFA